MISKTKGQVEYKVKYVGKVTEHRVRFEPSHRVVDCSCKKFDFVGILCAHALKVLDKKNIKQIPEQYILKRWTKYAKDGDIRTSIQVSGSSKELIGKRYFNLNYNFREIATLAAEDDIMYEQACEVFSKLLKDLRLMKRSSHGETNNDILDSNHEQDDPIVAGVKTKPTVGPPKGRLKGPLERRKN
ncbi:Protein FAR-RED IMPAIRED RESPONSE 1 [Linum grandiflorum]